MGNVYLEERQINLCMGVFYMVVLIIFGVLWRSKKKGENFETKFEYIMYKMFNIFFCMYTVSCFFG